MARLSIAVTTAVQFNGLYEAAIDGAERPSLPAKRIAAIIDHMTFEIYKYIQRGLFERHKLIFAWMLTASILVSAGKVRSPRARTFHCFQILSAAILGALNINMSGLFLFCRILLCRNALRVMIATLPGCGKDIDFTTAVKWGGHGVQIKAEDVNVFLRGGGALDINSVRKKPKARPMPGHTCIADGCRMTLQCSCTLYTLHIVHNMKVNPRTSYFWRFPAGT